MTKGEIMVEAVRAAEQLEQEVVGPLRVQLTGAEERISHMTMQLVGAAVRQEFLMRERDALMVASLEMEEWLNRAREAEGLAAERATIAEARLAEAKAREKFLITHLAEAEAVLGDLLRAGTDGHGWKQADAKARAFLAGEGEELRI